MDANLGGQSYLQGQSYPGLRSVTKLGQLIDIKKDNNFQESFEPSGGVGLSSRPFLI